jgi:hypothetical protein
LYPQELNESTAKNATIFNAILFIIDFCFYLICKFTV